ncbi:MAG TPA: hypothetical protein VJ987_01220 [Anaerolineales bacterium]|nr:hypothetical protein [Anaerolineales bacterium]
MAQFKILQALEDLIFEVMAWIMLLPKTLMRVIFAPIKAIKYVNSEWEKKPEERFDEFLSPIFFWIIVAVLPLTYVFLTEEDFQQSGILAIFLESKILLGAFIASLLLLFYLMWTELINNRPIRKSALKRMFYIQCYITSPAVLIITLIFRFTNTIQAFQEYLLASIAFVIFYEMFVMKIELEVGWRTALWRAVQPLLVTAVIVVIIIFALNI